VRYGLDPSEHTHDVPGVVSERVDPVLLQVMNQSSSDRTCLVAMIGLDEVVQTYLQIECDHKCYPCLAPLLGGTALVVSNGTTRSSIEKIGQSVQEQIVLGAVFEQGVHPKIQVEGSTHIHGDKGSFVTRGENSCA